ncbi:MAG: hypothetical protein LBV16_01240 [Elusimicrobiota bacterium]|jgi:ATP-dependent DNA helicase RecG|nr:hypothetical protein [Elusimicrobiota bacterium]
MEDLRTDLIDMARKRASIQKRGHQWEKMSDRELLKFSELYQRNSSSGDEGFTLAAVLLFGKDETIAATVPAYRIDMLKRVYDAQRYDDRLDIRTNLIDAFDLAMGFVQKHLPDPFYVARTMRISLRDTIFRELIANLLIHKEYLMSEVR